MNKFESTYNIKNANVEIFIDKSNKWRFNLSLQKKNGEWDIILRSSDTYNSEEDAYEMAKFIFTRIWHINESEIKTSILDSKLYQCLKCNIIILRENIMNNSCPNCNSQKYSIYENI